MAKTKTQRRNKKNSKPKNMDTLVMVRMSSEFLDMLNKIKDKDLEKHPATIRRLIKEDYERRFVTQNNQ